MKKVLAILLSLVMALSVFGVAVSAFDSDVMTELPTQDSEDFYPGEYWFDFAGYLEYELAVLAEECGGTESEEYQHRAEILRNRQFYISSDHLTLYYSDDGGERFADIDITSPELEEYQLACLFFLNRHQGDWTGYYLLPTEDSDELNDGDYWFDLDGFIEWGLDNGMPSDYAAVYSGASYYLPPRSAMDHIIVCGENDFFEHWYVAYDNYEPRFDFLKVHVSDVDFAPLPVEDSDELSDGDYWLDLENLLDYWAAEGIKPVMFLGDYSYADYYINGSASVILIDFGEDDVEYYYAAMNTCDIFDFLYRHGMCDHRRAELLPVGFQPCGACDYYLILDNVTDPAYLNYSYYGCHSCGMILVYDDGGDLVAVLDEDELYALGISFAIADWHKDEDDDGLCDNCGAYRLTEDVSDERYYLVVPDEERSYLRFAEIWACEKDGETVFDMMLEDHRFGIDDDEGWEEQYAILSGWITAPQISADQQAANAVIAKIGAIGEVWLDSKDAIDEARAAYDALTDAQKELVANYGTLTAAEETYADHVAAANVNALIEAIGEVAYTDECKAKIDAARNAYDALTDAQRDIVDDYLELTDAEEEYAALKAAADAAAEAAANQAAADAVSAKIDAIGEVAYTDECKAKIDEARAAYDALTDAQKELVANYETLTAAEERYDELKAAAETPDEPTEDENLCKWCGKDHSVNFWQKIVGVFHKILYFFAHLFGRR